RTRHITLLPHEPHIQRQPPTQQTARTISQRRPPQITAHPPSRLPRPHPGPAMRRNNRFKNAHGIPPCATFCQVQVSEQTTTYFGDASWRRLVYHFFVPTAPSLRLDLVTRS